MREWRAECAARRWRRYNFMPLARGTAAVGYLTLLSVFLAADMPISTRIPKVRGGGPDLCLKSLDPVVLTRALAWPQLGEF